MWVELSQKLARALGMVDVESKTSVLANMDRNMYMGSCRLGWERMTQIKCRCLPGQLHTWCRRDGEPDV